MIRFDLNFSDIVFGDTHKYRRFGLRRRRRRRLVHYTHVYYLLGIRYTYIMNTVV